MQAGQIALVLALAGSITVAIIAAWANHRGALIKRGSDMVSIYMARLRDTESDNDELKATVQTLREQHIVDLSALDKVTRLERQVAELQKRLDNESERTGEK